MSELDRRFVVVVGAGASTDFGLPVGSQLKENISKICATDIYDGRDGRVRNKTIENAVRNLAAREPGKYSFGSLFQACSAISKGMASAPSIDNYLDTHKDKPEVIAVGKMAIVYAISDAERRSKLYVDQSNIYNTLEFSRLQSTWLAAFTRILLAERSFEEFCDALSKIHFVTFNYDRCIQQYFVYLAKEYFFDRNDAPEIVLKNLNVTHVYGAVGEEFYQLNRNTDFGVELNQDQLLHRRSCIRTFTEGVDSDVVVDELESAFDDCEVLMFLGFGFHALNMDILPSTKLRSLEKILVTSRGQSKSDLEILRDRLSSKYGTFHNDIFFDAAEAADVFSEFYRFLSRAPTKI